jgi:hypothetical protein
MIELILVAQRPKKNVGIADVPCGSEDPGYFMDSCAFFSLAVT